MEQLGVAEARCSEGNRSRLHRTSVSQKSSILRSDFDLRVTEAALEASFKLVIHNLVLSL